MRISDRPLLGGTLVRRYQRFLCEVRLDGGATIVATCPNTGSMMGLVEPGNRVWLSEWDSPTRKYRHTWELVEVAGAGRPVLVGLNTGRTNAVVEEAVARGLVPELAGYASRRREQRYGARSRIDLLLEDPARPPCYVEIKNVTLSRRAGLAEFPDTVTARGTRHLDELAAMARAGARAVMLFVAQRGDVDRFSLAGDLDPAYLEAHARAAAAGVESLVYGCNVTPDEVSLHRALGRAD